MDNNVSENINVEGETLQAPATEKANLMLVLLALVGFAFGFVLFKLLPLQQMIMETYHISEGAYGFLNAAQNYISLVLLIPVGFLFRKWKARQSILFVGCFIVAGGLIMAFAPNFVFFVIGRAIEGAGVTLVQVLQFSLAANLAKPERRSVVVSIMVSSTMVAQVIYMAMAPSLLAKGITLPQLNIGIVAVVAVCFIILLAACPKDLKIYGIADSVRPTKEQTRKIFRDKNVWFVTLAYAFFYLAIVAFASYQVMYLMMRGLDMQNASNVVTFSSLLGIAAMIIWGILSDKLRTKRKIAIFSMFATAICMVLLVKTPLAIIWVYTIWLGTLPRSIIGVSNASSPDLADTPSDVAIVNSFRDTVNLAIMIVGGILTGFGLEHLGYDTTIYILGALTAVGGVLWIFAKKVK